MVQQEDCALWGSGTEDRHSCYPQSTWTFSPVNLETKEMYSQSRLVCADSIQDHLPPLHSKRGAERAPRKLPEEPQCLKEMFSGLAWLPGLSTTSHQGANLGKEKAIS